jgi:Spy/CpxP family protein refolding chaperone
MKKLLVTLSIVGISAAVLAQPFVGAERRGGSGRGNPHSRTGGGPQFGLLERHPEIAEEAGVTEEQMDELRLARYEQQKKMVELRADLELAELEMQQLMDNEAADREAVFSAVDQVSAARGALQKARIEQLWKVRDILGEETMDTLRELGREKMRERAEKRGRHKGGRSQRRGGADRGARWNHGPGNWDDEAPIDEGAIED